MHLSKLKTVSKFYYCKFQKKKKSKRNYSSQVEIHFLRAYLLMPKSFPEISKKYVFSVPTGDAMSEEDMLQAAVTISLET